MCALLSISQISEAPFMPTGVCVPIVPPYLICVHCCLAYHIEYSLLRCVLGPLLGKWNALVDLTATLKLWPTTCFSAWYQLKWICASYVCIRLCDALRIFSGITLYAVDLPDFVYIFKGVQAGRAVCHLRRF